MIDRKFARVVLTAIFVGLLALPLVLKQFRTQSEAASSSLESSAALKRYGFYLTEIAESAGAKFLHQAPTLDPKLDHIMPQVASMGASVSIVDYDRDGWSDIYVTNSGEGSKNALYRNLGDGSFKDVAAELGIADVNQPGTGVSMGAV
ncbi:MAG TPA: VCBS repeat-containing protein, partial [Pyrinomonadaceae bacterium]|nr:VCBS repeat-containing protein [Pyrinomonadaceae bacterium]